MLTILMPCLNEEETIGICIEKAKSWIAKIDIDDIAVIKTEQIERRKKEEWQCKTLKDWFKLAEKRGHKPYWAKKRWEIAKKRKRKENYDDDDLFGF